MEDQVQDNGEEQTLEEQYKGLEDTIRKERARFLKNAFDFIARNGRGHRIPDEESKLHQDHERMIAQLEKSRIQIHKLLYSKGPKNSSSSSADVASADIEKIKSMDSTVGAIVRKIG